jgi:ABC-type transport system involved in cytochrome bd biosynthesis fused ATPase/permease subunit
MRLAAAIARGCDPTPIGAAARVDRPRIAAPHGGACLVLDEPTNHLDVASLEALGVQPCWGNHRWSHAEPFQTTV